MKARKKKAAQRAAKRTTEMKEKIATNAENKKAEVVDSTEKTTAAKNTTKKEVELPEVKAEPKKEEKMSEIKEEPTEETVYTSGATNIFKYPELADSSKASELISAFEDKQELVEMIKDTVSDSGENTGIQVYIGNESPIQTMKDCSVVTASYDLGEGMKGTIGIIGPKRMDYENVVDNLKTLKVQLDNIFKKP